jgi:hypothetical protein
MLVDRGGHTVKLLCSPARKREEREREREKRERRGGRESLRHTVKLLCTPACV